MPGKNLRNLCGKPLIRWTVEQCLQCKWLDAYAVCSDNVDILDAAGVGDWIIEPRVPDDRTRMVSLKYAIAVMERRAGAEYDAIVDVRCTNPFVTADDIDACVRMLQQTGAESAISVTRLHDHHPQRAKYLEMGRIRDFLPEPADGLRQNLFPDAYVRNGAIYAYRRDALLGEQGKLFGHEFSLAYEMPNERSINIDTEMDWKLAEVLMRERQGTA